MGDVEGVLAAANGGQVGAAHGHGRHVYALNATTSAAKQRHSHTSHVIAGPPPPMECWYYILFNLERILLASTRVVLVFFLCLSFVICLPARILTKMNY